MLWTAPRRVESLSWVQCSSARRVGRHKLSSVMQQQHLGILGGLTAAIAIGGCVPATYVQVPALQGRVAGQDGCPNAAAVVHVVRDSDHVEVATIPTAIDGTFRREQQCNLTIQFAGADRR